MAAGAHCEQSTLDPPAPRRDPSPPRKGEAEAASVPRFDSGPPNRGTVTRRPGTKPCPRHLSPGLLTAVGPVLALSSRKGRPPEPAKTAGAVLNGSDDRRLRALGRVEFHEATLRSHQFASERFHVLLNSLFKVLFNFPSRYLSAIGLVSVFSLRWSLPPTLGCIPKQPDSEDALRHADPRQN